MIRLMLLFIAVFLTCYIILRSVDVILKDKSMTRLNIFFALASALLAVIIDLVKN